MGIADAAERGHRRWHPGVAGHLARSGHGGDVAVLAVGSAFLVAGLVVLAGLNPGIHWSEFLLNAFLDVGLAGAAIFGGLILRRSDLTDAERWIAAEWYVGGIAFLIILVTWAAIPELLGGAPAGALLDLYVLFGNLGGILGLVAGFNRARATQNDRLLAELRQRRDQLEFINRLLRHNVLNSVQAIDGYATLVAPEVEGEVAEYIAQIEAGSARIAELVEDVRTLITTLDGEVDTRPIDLSAMVSDEVALLRRRYPDATIETDIPSGIRAWGNPVLSAAFENLLDNAVVHNDADHPQVSVAVERDTESVTVRIADDGPGIPPAIVERYFEGSLQAEGRGESLGLYLVAVLVDLVDGDVSVVPNDPRGSVVAVTLPTADDPAKA